MGLLPAMTAAPNDKYLAANGQASISVGHEELRTGEDIDISTNPEVLRSTSRPGTNLLAAYA